VAPVPLEIRLPPVKVEPDQVPKEAKGRLNLAEK
jgi:hypothetical protein